MNRYIVHIVNYFNKIGGEKMLKLEKITKSFKDEKVLQELDLEVGEKDLIHIKGANGCGKSTLFKIITGILSEDSGQIYKDDNIKIGALIENPGFIENESLKYNLKFLLSLTHYNDEKKMEEYCNRLGLDLQNRKSIKKYSLGMRQIAGIIQAIMENQNLILLDEPTRGLDDDSVKEFNKILKELQEENKTIIIASHEGHEGLAFTKNYIMKQGKLIQL